MSTPEATVIAVQISCPHCRAAIKEVGFTRAVAIWRTDYFEFDQGGDLYDDDTALQIMDKEADGDPVEGRADEFYCGKCGQEITGDLADVLALYAGQAEAVY